MAGRPLRMILAGDNTSAIKAIAGVQNEMGKFTANLAGLPAKGGGAFKGLGSAIGASGVAGQFGELQTMLGNLSGAFNTMGEKGKTSFGKIVTGVGVAAAAAGGIGLMASKPLQDANAQLKQSIENNGGTWEDFAGQIAKADKKMEGLGHTNADTNEALSKLTQAFNSPEKAMEQLSLTANIAARNHDSLAASADTVIKVHAGSTRALKAYGINTKDTTELGKAATKAQKAQTVAHDKYTAALERQKNLKERLGAATGTKDAAADAKVLRAQDALAKAGLHLQAVQKSLAGGHKSAAAGAAELQGAQAGVTAASKKLDEAEAASTGTAKLSVAQQQELKKVNDDVAAAKKKVDETDKAAAATKSDLDKSTVTEAVALQMLTDKTKGLADAQSDTFGGKLRAAKATVTDFAAHVGQKYGGMLITAGPALAGLGGLVQSNIIGKAASGIGSLVKFGAQAATWSAKMILEGGKAMVAWAADMLGISTASQTSATETMAAWGPVLIAFAALGATIFVASKDWAVTWIGMKDLAQGAVNGILDAVGWILTAFAQFSKGIANMLELATQIPGVGDRFKGMAASARQGEQDLTQWAANLHKGIDITSKDIAKYQAGQALTGDTSTWRNEAAAALVAPTVLPAAAGAPAAGAPAVASYGDTNSIVISSMTVQAANVDDFKRAIEREAVRGNFSGAGHAVAAF